ncbi:hypothetical protein NP493_280g01031 [Ridgeia piscesae]|uniref:Uncharacterized protein n=1 Tax=Ridgeia piscesae TaxID=27915 RepID=A0AAD9NX92_RIDPI|nr:hypothetical protein NP493_280g01031 [Ridgeia piscesae]
MNVKLAGGRASLPLLVLLAVSWSRCPHTAATNPPEHVLYYLACIQVCVREDHACCKDCDVNNTCEASRQFCKELCLKAATKCNKKCFRETFVPHRPSVDLLLLLAIINSLSPQTVSSRVPLHVRYYLSCAASCGLEGDECGTRCEENNTCEASRQFCKNLCRRAENACFRRCSEEAVEKYHDNE